jgi:hypothetical protein
MHRSGLLLTQTHSRLPPSLSIPCERMKDWQIMEDQLPCTFTICFYVFTHRPRSSSFMYLLLFLIYLYFVRIFIISQNWYDSMQHKLNFIHRFWWIRKQRKETGKKPFRVFCVFVSCVGQFKEEAGKQVATCGETQEGKKYQEFRTWLKD